MRIVWVMATGALLAAGWGLWSWSPAPAQLVTTAPTRAAAPPRCPERALEDHGVCIPVPAPVAHAGNFIALSPDRPDALSDYALPVPGPSEIAVATALPLPAHFKREGPALIIQVAEPQIAQLGSLDLRRPRVAAVDAEASWILLRSQPETGPVLLVLLSGLSGIALQPGATELDLDARLGSVETALVLVVRQASEAEPAAEAHAALAAWSNPTSVAVDPRNVLRPSSAASAPSASSLTE